MGRRGGAPVGKVGGSSCLLAESRVCRFRGRGSVVGGVHVGCEELGE